MKNIKVVYDEKFTLSKKTAIIFAKKLLFYC